MNMPLLGMWILTAFCLAFLSSGCSAEPDNRTVPIEDGRVVVLSGEGAVALLKVSNQRLSPEVMDYDCLWRTDGVTKFKEGDEKVFASSGKDKKSIAFGPFAIGWSVEGSGGKGWLYLDKFPGGKGAPQRMKYLVTNHRHFAQVTHEEILTVLESDRVVSAARKGRFIKEELMSPPITASPESGIEPCAYRGNEVRDA